MELTLNQYLRCGALFLSLRWQGWPGVDASSDKLMRLEADALRWQEACERTNAQVWKESLRQINPANVCWRVFVFIA